LRYLILQCFYCPHILGHFRAMAQEVGDDGIYIGQFQYVKVGNDFFRRAAPLILPDDVFQWDAGAGHTHPAIGTDVKRHGVVLDHEGRLWMPSPRGLLTDRSIGWGGGCHWSLPRSDASSGELNIF